jgi:hypothetical protein
MHPDEVEEAKRRWRHSIESGEPYQREGRFRRRTVCIAGT